MINGSENAYVQAWSGDQPGLNLVIFRQPGANIVETVDRIQAELPRLQVLLLDKQGDVLADSASVEPRPGNFERQPLMGEGATQAFVVVRQQSFAEAGFGVASCAGARMNSAARVGARVNSADPAVQTFSHSVGVSGSNQTIDGLAGVGDADGDLMFSCTSICT